MYPYMPYWDDDRGAEHVSHPDRKALAGSQDEMLAHRVADRFLADPRIRSGHVVVDAQNGVVILEGRLDSEEACEAAALLSWSTPGVRDVSSRLSARSRA